MSITGGINQYEITRALSNAKMTNLSPPARRSAKVEHDVAFPDQLVFLQLHHKHKSI